MAAPVRAVLAGIRDRVSHGLRPRLRPRSRAAARLLTLLAFLGPGLIAANAGNDAGGVATYASVGAKYGYDLLWMMVLITVSLIVVQEMAARMGAVTGKGLAELIREQYGVRWSSFADRRLAAGTRRQLSSAYLGLGFVATVGTTITPFMQLYVQSAVVERGIGPEDLNAERGEVVTGSIFANLVACFIIIATGRRSTSTTSGT